MVCPKRDHRVIKQLTRRTAAFVNRADHGAHSLAVFLAVNTLQRGLGVGPDRRQRCANAVGCFGDKILAAAKRLI